jgi:DNA gyrase subunit A
MSTENIIPINIEEEMKVAYIDYSMSVIVSRALPDVRDGLKPVHRRVLYGMDQLGVNYNRSYKKSARIVGEVLGKYHPHGDSSVYDTMVRMAQEWSLRYPLVDGQGNYGSIDGDSPAAMRYTEARLKRIAEELLGDIKKRTVDFQPNFDDSLKEPTVLPAKVPNLLLNGASGIAVGMATNMAPHNLTEVVDGIIAYIGNIDIDIDGLMEFIKAPDFPTGAIIYGMQGVKQAFETGRGRVMMRSHATFEVSSTGKEQIVVSDVPYMVNKATLIEKTAALINERKLEGISDLRDESDRDGLRIVYDLKRDAIPNVVLNNLYKYTQLQTSFSVNNVALVKGRPETLNLKDMIVHYVDHRHEVVVRRTQFELEEAEKRAHILEGYLIALDHLDEVIKLIRGSRDPEIARNGLIEKFELSEIQARAILDMRLQRLTGLERDKIQLEYDELMILITDLKDILASEERIMQIIKDELALMRERYGDKRRSEIVMSADEISIEDIIADEEMVITISNEGYIKRTPLTDYKTQNRGGRGSKGAGSKDKDFTEHLFMATMHNYMLIFTDKGKVYWLRVYEVPEGQKAAKGRPLQNLINIESGERVQAVVNVKTLKDEDYINNNYLMMCTKNGTIKKTSLEAYSRPRTNGINAISINEGDSLLDVKMTTGNNNIVIAKRSGKAIRFHESNVRSMGRGATGVRGVRLEDENDSVVGFVCIEEGEERDILVVSENGYGKRSNIDEYRTTSRGGKGVKTISITEKTGALVGILSVNNDNDLMIINKSGILIRLDISTLRVMGRATQGVRLIKLTKNDMISSIARIEKVEETEEELEEGEAVVNEGESPETSPDENTESSEESSDKGEE